MDIAHSDDLFIGSRWVKPASYALADVVSPFDGSVVCQLPRPSVEDAKLAAESAAGAFNAWNALDVNTRIDYVAKFAAAMEARADEIATVWSLESGMPITQCQGIVASGADLWNLAFAEARRAEWVETRDTGMGIVEVRREGTGPTVAIPAFNGPHVQFALAILPALVAGNTMIVKMPVEIRMLSYLFAAAAEDADFPEGVLSIMAGDVDVSAYLVEHPSIAAVHFTGGTEIGTAVARAAVDRMAQVVLELGGKSAAIVAEDADMEFTLDALADGMAFYSGQICVAMTRMLVPRSTHANFVAELTDRLRQLKIGDPRDPETEWGPLASDRYRERAEGFIRRAVADGATIAYGGSRPEGFDSGYFLEPTLLTNVTSDMEVAQEEIFGPVFVVIPYDTLDEAIDIANDSKYGLAGSVFTTDKETGMKVARAVRTGAFNLNGTFPCLAGPYGGMKLSGVGREGGPEGLFALTQTKTITLG